MSYSDAELIKRTLDGDETAFGFLVDKYKGAVHALAYRKLGDFHIAEEITQDTFLKAYQKLGTLKDPKLLPGWLYVIAARCCISWLRKNRLRFQSLDIVDKEQINSLAWAKYAGERVREEVHDALESLPESERTVLTLYYLAGLTCEEIARFMGTSRSAIKNRLYRARLCLKKEMTMIQETLGTFQLPSTLTQQIMGRIHRMKPTPAPSGKPSAPWKPLAPWLAATTLVVVALFVGLGVMQSARFRLPYSLDGSESAIIVELTEEPVFEMPMPKRTITKGYGRLNAGAIGIGNQSNGVALALAANSQEGEDTEEIGWTQTNGPYGGTVLTFLATPEGTLYAGTQGAGIFRSSDGGNSWTPVNTGMAVYEDNRIPTIFSLAIMGNTLYAGTGGDIFRSVSGGEEWQQITWFRNRGVDALAVIGNTLYAGRAEEGVLRSTDMGDSWTEVSMGLTDLHIRELAVMGTTLYAGTKDGAFRLLADDGNAWIPINAGLTAPRNNPEAIKKAMIKSGAPPVPISKFMIDRRVDSFAVSGGMLYMGMVNGLFCSVDKGKSWTQIGSETMKHSISALDVSGKNLYAGTFGGGVFRSTDGGDSWTEVSTGLTNHLIRSLLAVEGTIYVGTSGGVFRLVDGEDAWTEINNGLTNTTVSDLVFLGTTLYGSTGKGIVRTVDGGKSWAEINTGLTTSRGFPHVSELVVSGPTLYAATTFGPGGGVFRLEDGGDSWIEINPKLGRIHSLVVIGTTFYAGTSGKGVFRLEAGDDSWTNLGVPDERIESLAVSGTKLFAGAARGGVFRSVDGGKSWTQVNEGLTNGSIQDLVFVGTTLYAGTFGDGVFRSTDGGDSWMPINEGLTDTTITTLMVSGTTLYAGTHYHGVFRLEKDDDSWQPVGLMHRDVRSLAVSGRKIYAGTMDGGVFRIPLGKGQGFMNSD